MGMLVSWFIISLSVWLTAKLLPGFQIQGGFGSAVVIAALIGILKWLLELLIGVFIGVATLGLGFIFWNVTQWIAFAIILKLVDVLSHRLSIKGFGTALVASLCITVIGMIAHSLLLRHPI